MVNILNVPVSSLSMQETVNFIQERLQKQEQTFAVTANAEIIMMAQNDSAYLELLKRTDIITPDGAGVVWAAKHLGSPVPERVAGYDLFHQLLQLAAKTQKKVYFFGGKPGIAEQAKAKALELYPGLKIAGCRNGYFQTEENETIINDINNSGAEMLFAALGAPKQEFWLDENKAKLHTNLLMGIGGSFDVLSGKTTRAPLWMQKAGLEWLYRLMKEPYRFRRMASTLPQFVLKILFGR
ncbi:MAG: WecB/TagA/CpsF family glycosyltransferase [Acidaminococcaceae bacterium]|nr:WecB/TagA/CpsF family glycosyltransferase [Acidaminococcaceae bacterium]